MKKFIIPIVMLTISLTLLIAAKAEAQQIGLAEKLLRVHIIANSDSALDQQEKLLVRDRILKLSNELLKDATSIDEVKNILSKNLPLFASEAKKISRFSAKAELCKAIFPTRHYDNFTLPAGEYDAIRIILGEGKGKNWWCVMFPPLCTNAVEVCESTDLTEDEIKLISSGENVYRYEFKVLELLSLFKKACFQ